MVRGRIRHDAVPAPTHLLVLAGVELAAATHPLGDAAVAVGVHDQRAPTLGRLRITGALVDLDSEPADDRSHGAEIQPFTVVEAELQMVGIETAIDQLHCFFGGVIEGDMAGGTVEGIVLGIGITRTLPAPIRIARPADLMGHPHPALAVHHRVVRVARVVPDQLIAPDHGGLQVALVDVGSEIAFAGNISHGNRYIPRLVRGRIDPNQLIVGEADAVDRATGVDTGIAFVAGDLIMNIASLATPFPHGQYHVALQALRSRRHRRHFAIHDAIGPVGIHVNHVIGAEAAQPGTHQASPLTSPGAMNPGRLGSLELGEIGDLARGQIAKLVTELTALLETVDPVSLAAHSG